MAAGGVALILLVLLATANVALRIFRVPLGGAYELVSFLGALVIASALGYTQKRKDHIVVDILSDRFPPRVRRVLDAVSCALSAALFGIAAWRLFVLGSTIHRAGELSETLKIPYHPFIYGVAAGFALFVVTLLLDVVDILFRGGGGP